MPRMEKEKQVWQQTGSLSTEKEDSKSLISK